MSPARAELQRVVATRAAHRCEYCRMHQSLQGASFHLEHIVPVSLGGTDEPNHERRCRVRQAEELFGLFPPAESL